MHDFVQQTERIHFTDGHRFFAFFRPDRVDLCGEVTRSTDVCENHIAVIGKQLFREIITFSGFAGDVEFHICTPLFVVGFLF